MIYLNSFVDSSSPFFIAQVIGNSMLPTLHNNDLVLIMRAEEYALGDIVVVSTLEKQYIIHRIIKKINKNSKQLYLTKGDNISNIDRWYTIQNIHGKVVSLLESKQI